MIDKDLELNNIKILLDITDDKEDNKLKLYMEDAEQSILDITNRTELLDSMKSILREYTIYLYNNHDTFGISSETEGEESISYNTTDKLPIHILNKLNRYKRNRCCLFYED